MSRLKEYIKKLSWEDIKSASLMLITFVPAMVLRLLKKDDIWIICERENNAEDNGWIFYHWLRKNKPDQPVYFILDKSAPSYDLKDPHMVSWGSVKHYIYYQASWLHIRTMFNRPYPSRRICEYYECIFKKTGVYLRHGITTSGLEHHRYEVQQARIFVCGAKPEYDYVTQNGGYPEGYVQYTGFARFDDLLEKMSDDRFVLIMPTWRRYIGEYTNTVEENEELFLQSSYYQHFQSLLSNTSLVDFILNAGYKIKFCIHAQFLPYLHLFSNIDSRIDIVERGASIHELLMSTSLLITDYSSVLFDVAYMKKPMIFYQFDFEEFRLKHISEGYFSYRLDGMGPVVETEDALLKALKDFYDGEQFVNSEFYLQRCSKFFPTHDNHNCERIYKAIKEINR